MIAQWRREIFERVLDMAMNIEERTAVEKALNAGNGAVLEYIARENNVTAADVVSCLPAHEAVTISGDKFVEVMTEIANWGEITFLVHTDDLILEAKGSVPAGSEARGFYNLHGNPIGGHLKNTNCDSISFVTRPIFQNDSCSVQFYNKDGGSMFKIYLGRDDNRQLIPEQVESFEKYRDQMASGQ
jgi:heme iron utilization protein